ncbi:hypothetical protein [Methanolacinia petrolearia]|nr:hypothetical protein [Methanolacinia petrolearia]
MKNQSRYLSYLLMTAGILLILLSFFGGCTTTGSVQDDGSQSGTTVPTETPEINRSYQPESSSSPVSWRDYYPEYDEQTKSELIEEAKDEIQRVFPNVERDSLEGVWNDETDFIIDPYPNIKFNNVTNGIRYIWIDPTSNRIINYNSKRYSTSMSGPNVVSFNTAVNKSLNFAREILGDEFMNRIGDDLVLESNNVDSYLYTGDAAIYIYETCGGVKYERSYVSVSYNLRAGEVQAYGDNRANKNLLTELTTLSPEPDITLDMAKEIFESKLKEQYGLDDIGIEYVDKDRFYPSLYWLDRYSYVYSENPVPLKLIWEIPYTTEIQRSEDGYDEDIDAPKEVIIDAHTGEILLLTYNDELLICEIE